MLLVLALVAFITGAGSVSANGTKTIHAKALDDHECNSAEWHFVITQIESEALAPASIHVVWANGNEQDVGRSAFTGKTAHYVTSANLDSTVTDAYTQIYEAWCGQFNLSHGPCPPPPPPSECDEACEKNADCIEGLICVGGVCRNPACPGEASCECPPPPAMCDESCEENTDCGGNLVCHAGVCRNPDCPEETDCLCPPPPPAECDEACERDTDCSGALVCYEGACRNPVCPEETDCICVPPPGGCNEVCEVDGGCEEGLICYYGRCRDPVCPEVKNCQCPPCPNAKVFKRVTQCGAPVSGVCVRLLSSWGDIIPSPDKDPICTDGAGIAYFSRGLGITPRDNKTWAVEVSGEIMDYFKVLECEMTIELTNELPCPPTPTPPPEFPKELPKTGIGPPPTSNLPNRFAPVGLSLIVLGGVLGILRKMRG